MKPSIHGIWPAVLIAAIAYTLGQQSALVGGTVWAILIGMAVGSVWKADPACRGGVAFVSRYGLQAGIVMIGAGLDLQRVWTVGSQSVVLIVIVVATALLGAAFLGKLMGVEHDLKTLIGVGTAICGGTAIAAVSPVVRARDEDISYAISAIFLCSVFAVPLCPLIGHVLGMTQAQFGLWAGTAINDTSSVVAAGYAYGTAAGDWATIVKLTRILMIVPVTLFYAVRSARSSSDSGGSALTSIPNFLLLFLAASLINSIGLLPDALTLVLPRIGRFLIVTALAAIGLKTDLRAIARTGYAPLMLGFSVWVLVMGVSALSIRILF